MRRATIRERFPDFWRGPCRVTVCGVCKLAFEGGKPANTNPMTDEARCLGGGGATSGDSGTFLVRVRALPPKRDAFALALGTLRRRLRQGIDAPGDALPIQLVASELRLSTTPVREVLSRLAGEHLVEKRGPVYTRPHLDGATLAELYALRALLLETAMAPDAGRRARRRTFPERPVLSLGDALAAVGQTPADLVTTLFFELVLAAGDLILAQAYQAATERLASYQPLEAQVFSDLDAEALGLIAAFEAQEPRALLLGAKAYHRRRIAAAGAISSLALGEKYRTDMV